MNRGSRVVFVTDPYLPATCFVSFSIGRISNFVSSSGGQISQSVLHERVGLAGWLTGRGGGRKYSITDSQNITMLVKSIENKTNHCYTQLKFTITNIGLWHIITFVIFL